MNRLVQISAIVFLLMFVFVEIAEARLIRAGGRKRVTYQHETNYYFVENANLVELSNFTGMNADSYFGIDNGGFVFGETTKSTGGGGAGISAVPTNGPSSDTNCNNSYDFGQPEPAESPCEWRITEGEDFTAFGNFSLFFDSPLIEHEITWSISDDNGVIKTITGLLNTGDPIDTPDGTIGTGNVMLDALWSDIDLLPGVYGLSVAATVSSTAGQFFYETRRLGTGTAASEVILEQIVEPNPAYDDWVTAYEEWLITVLYPWQDDPNRLPPEPTFDIPEPPFDLVGYVMQGEGLEFVDATNALMVDSRFSLLDNFPPETFVIEAANTSPPANPVNSPAAFMFVIFGGLFAFIRRVKLSKV